MVKVWFDLLTPKHYIFYKFLEDSIDADVVVTIRDYEELNRARSRLKLKTTPRRVGQHGGSDVMSKLEAGIQRQIDLLEIIRKEGVDGVVSFGSPDAARIGFGLGLPHIMICDSPHSIFVSKLTVPLSTGIFTPWVIPKSAWTRYGIPPNRISKYHSIDAALWINKRDLWPAKTRIERMGEGAIVIREEESRASYLNRANNPINIGELARAFPDERFLVLRRYVKGRKSVENVQTYGGPFFGPNIIEGAKLFIGRGGTMTAEAALMGIPTISFFPATTTLVDAYLQRAGAIDIALNQRDMMTKVKRIIDGDQAVKKIDTAKFVDLSEYLPPRIMSAIAG